MPLDLHPLRTPTMEQLRAKHRVALAEECYLAMLAGGAASMFGHVATKAFDAADAFLRAAEAQAR